MGLQGNSLWKAAKDGDVITVCRLLDNGADINQTNKVGDNALYWAVYSGSYDTVSCLLSRGADVAIMTAKQYPIHLAAAQGRQDIVELLLENGADPNVEDRQWRKPVDVARENGHSKLAIFFDNLEQPVGPKL